MVSQISYQESNQPGTAWMEQGVNSEMGSDNQPESLRGLTNFRNPELREFIAALPNFEEYSHVSDRCVFRLIAAIDQFQLVDEEWLELDDPAYWPASEVLSEILLVLTSPENAEHLRGFFERESQDANNPHAIRMWNYLLARLEMAEYAAASQTLPETK